jgi:hypothetical protein
MEEDDPFPRVITFDRLFTEERPGEVAEPEPASYEESRELARPVMMPPLSATEEEKAPDIRLDSDPDPSLDDPAVTDGMKSSDSYVETKLLKEKDGKLLRPWDDVDLS